MHPLQKSCMSLAGSLLLFAARRTRKQCTTAGPLQPITCLCEHHWSALNIFNTIRCWATWKPAALGRLLRTLACRQPSEVQVWTACLLTTAALLLLN